MLFRMEIHLQIQLSSSSSLTSTTLPEIGAYNSDTVLTDSTLPNVSPSLISSSVSGNSTKQYHLTRFVRIL